MSEKLKRFEVSLYNKQVRECDEQDKEHPNFNRTWANLNYLVYEGKNEQEIMDQVRKRHPERKGFVIDKIVEIKEYEFVKPVGQRF